MNFCIHCMTPLSDGTAVCPHCGKQQAYLCPENHLRPGTLLGAGRYLLGAAIGEGGFGITYIARDLRLNALVAIKEFYPAGYANRNSTYSKNVSAVTSGRDFFELGRKKFLDEAQLLAGLRDESGIVDATDFFEENNTAYIVMNFLHGETLKSYLKRVGRISYQETYQMLRPVIRSLHTAHERGVIHRDIAPDNIMLTRDGAKLLDFGAAREVFSADDRSLSIMLKRGYSPVEQYSHRNQGPWTDIYALCATMYRCITGKPPVDALERMEVQMPTPSQLGVAIPPRVEAVLMTGLALQADRRYRNLDDFLRALDAAMNAPVPPVPIPPPVPVPVPDPKKKKSKTEKGNGGSTKWIVMAIVAVLILAGVGFGVWWTMREKPSPEPTTKPSSATGSTQTPSSTDPTTPPDTEPSSTEPTWLTYPQDKDALADQSPTYQKLLVRLQKSDIAAYAPTVAYDAEEKWIAIHLFPADGSKQELLSNENAQEEYWNKWRDDLNDLSGEYREAFLKEGLDLDCYFQLIDDEDNDYTLLSSVNGEIRYDILVDG